MSQKDFALATGISQSTISDWKTKRTNPAADKILVICDVLGVTPVELLTSGDQFKSYELERKDIVITSPERKVLIERINAMDDRQATRLLEYLNMLN